MSPRYCYCIHAGNHNTITLQLLHHGVPGVDGCHPQMYRKANGGRMHACGRHGTVHLPGAHRSYWIYFMFTIVLKTDDAASTILLQDYSTHTTRGSCCELQGDGSGRRGSASSWHKPRTQLEGGRPRLQPTRTWSSSPTAI